MSSSTESSQGEAKEKTSSQEEQNVNSSVNDIKNEGLTPRTSSYRLYITTAVAIFALICSASQLDSLNSFAEKFSSTLCDTASLDFVPEEGNETTSIKSSLSSIFDPILMEGEKYDALAAIKSRSKEMQTLCHRYADRMRPESKSTMKRATDTSAFVYYPTKSFAVCTIPGIARQGIRTLLSKGDPNEGQNRQEFLNHYPSIMEQLKKVILVRHPMERLVSVYRSTYGPKMDGEKKVDAKASFNEFIHIVINGYYELQEHLDEQEMTLSSAHIDTGMIDGVTGLSKKWNAYWQICGLCNMHFKPQYILHMEHAQEDFQALADVLMEQDSLSDAQKEEIKTFISTVHPIKSRDPATLELYYSQMTKREIRKLYEKYRIDHELFGFTPDYFIKFGKGD